MNSAIFFGCFFVSMLLCARGYPTGAPPEACRHMIPGHGVPAQTGTSNPYKVMTSKTTFSCPGDTITVSVTGNSFRGFLCQPVPNTGALIQNPHDPVKKQNKCGQMASLTHIDNSIKSSVSFIWKPQTTQSVNIVCTVVQAKLYFWTNISSQTLRYVKSQCQPRPETREHGGSDVEQPGTDVSNTADVGKDSVPDTVNIPDSRTDQVPDSRMDNQLEKDGTGPGVHVGTGPGVHVGTGPDIHDGTGIDPTDTTDGDGKNAGQITSVFWEFVLALVLCVLFL